MKTYLRMSKILNAVSSNINRKSVLLRGAEKFTQILVSLPLRSQSRWCGRARKSAVIAIMGVASLPPSCSYLSLARFRSRGVWMSAARRFAAHTDLAAHLCAAIQLSSFVKCFIALHKVAGEKGYFWQSFQNISDFNNPKADC